MANKKAIKYKQVTIKEIVDAFYSGVSPVKLNKLAQKLVEQEDAKKVIKSIRDR